MASLSVSITPRNTTTADLYGSFTGGESSYSYSRRLAVTIYQGGSVDRSVAITSLETGGADSTFSGTFVNLSPGVTYTWSATLQYWAGYWEDSSYTDSGSFTMYADTHYVTITFNADGGSPTPASISGSYTDPDTYVQLQIPATIPSKEGYSFEYWQGVYGTYRPNEYYRFTATQTLTAVYSAYVGSGKVKIKTSSGWVTATPYVKTSSGWQPAIAVVFDGTTWRNCDG